MKIDLTKIIQHLCLLTLGCLKLVFFFLIHQRHLHFLMVEIYKSITQTISYISYFSHQASPHNLSNKEILFFHHKIHSSHYGRNALHFRETLIWHNLTRYMRSSKSLFKFKRKRKKSCECRLWIFDM